MPRTRCRRGSVRACALAFATSANLCWKLGAVLRGSLPESVLDTYQSERLPHVKEVTNRAVKIGKDHHSAQPLRAAAAQSLLPHREPRCPASRIMAAPTPLAARCALPQGTARHNGNGAVGWLIPQPWVVDEKGDAVRLDDVIGGRWAVLHRRAAASGCQAWREARRPGRSKFLCQAAAPAADSVRGHRRCADPLARTRRARRWWSCDPTGSSTQLPRGSTAAASPGRFQSRRRNSSNEPSNRVTPLTERTVRVNGKDDLRRRGGTGAPVVLLHGGGPGASGRVELLTQHRSRWPSNFRVIVPDMPGYGRSAKGVDRSDPFGYLADSHPRNARRTRHRARPSGRQLLWRFVRLRLALDTPHRVDRLVLMGPGGIGTTRGSAHRRAQKPAGLLRR